MLVLNETEKEVLRQLLEEEIMAVTAKLHLLEDTMKFFFEEPMFDGALKDNLLDVLKEELELGMKFPDNTPGERRPYVASIMDKIWTKE